ncbi:BREX-2 system adenine-specific DNA-methyltransferase PglX [Streptomyces sp. 5-6(2022)]|uniref:BREX-2 system adenine-specific DNA-methyltransferase PglX n=1 Tax=Streptomyces sp. 5-6(2022) TaxID=2936510 RepID=UPI0023B9BC75|nr:BREX-2 system adenine-specific DNA-methyltransferase PglX [Streptomyces sp. 5-6(2022)]
MNGAGLLKDLKKQVTALEDDLRERSESVEEFRTRLEGEYARAREGKRTAATYGAWRDERVTQAAAAWVLGCVFVRFCEDNGLIEWPFLAGPGERLRDAEERHEAFFREKPHLNNRDWLIEAFQHLSDANETAAGLFDRRHNPLWELTPSYEAASELLAFWRRRGADGEILFDFTDEEWDTRFLGDLYQDLSEHARKTYALLQTPEFVEEFILDLTLEPAIEEFGLNPEGGLRTIDPACGSGHFLLGIFARLVKKWRAAEPGTDEWVVVRRALDSVHGCDKNPFAASIARFRLLVAAMRAAGARRLVEAPTFPINVAVGDSLLHGRGAAGIQTDLDTLFAAEGDGDGAAFQYATEDVGEFASRVDLLGRGSYHVVVGNPPYITVKDKRENENYRKAYDACGGAYALSVPFAQRIFELAVRASGDERAAGLVGQITANSFMKRQFGRKLVEEYFAQRVTLTHVIDTSGAYIPGHGTPTVILVGKNRVARESDTVRAVLGIRGEPVQPKDPSRGNVWSAIVRQAGSPGSESVWVSVIDSGGRVWAAHPWSLGGGGAGELLEVVNSRAQCQLDAIVESVGSGAVTREDSAYMLGSGALRRAGLSADQIRPLVEGDVVRDYAIVSPVESIWPYESDTLRASEDPDSVRLLWPHRSILRERVAFGKSQIERGLAWFEYSMFFDKRYRTPLTIAYAEVATHNHFVLDRGGKVFNRTAPVIKLSEGASVEEHFKLLGLLNSSTACFWMNQVCHDKGSQSGTGGFMHDEWERFHQYSGTRISQFPVPVGLSPVLACNLDSLSQELMRWEPSEVCRESIPVRAALDDACASRSQIWQRMIALQEELDWHVYALYGLLDELELKRLTVRPCESTAMPEVRLGERAFEIVLARKVARGETETVWFDRHGSTPVTEVPSHWPDWYQGIVQARIDVIESRKDIALIERPECKRRWASEPWEKKEKVALRTWLLDRVEEPSLWYGLRDGMRQPRALTVSQLADALRDDADFNSVAQLYATDHMGKPDVPLADVLTEIVADEHVPYLAAMRYKDSGLRNREQWEQVWEMQREEDRTGERLDIPVPPKYKGADFQKHSYWSNRGKLDVPKERFISYLEASPDADPTILLGWAGWDHKDQAQALFNLIDDRTKDAGWGTDRIKPLLAGVLEVMPWVRQWHGEYDEEWEGVPADEYQAYFEELCAKHQVSEVDLRAWRPEKKTRSRKKAAAKKADAEQPALDSE